MLKLSDKNVNNKMYEDYLKYLLEKYCNINNNIINNNPFLHFSCFYPLPNSLEVTFYDNEDKIIKENNTYEFAGTQSSNLIIFANRLLPNPTTDPIPFTFPIKLNENTTELINSNCFYYEVTIAERTRDPWNDEIISIGYGSITTPLKCNPVSISDTVEYHLNDGTIQYNQIIVKEYGPIYNIGDTFGAIIVYISQYSYKIFFTFNGSLIVNKKFNNKMFIKSQVIPIIGYNHSCKIKVNFGNDMFKFDIKNFCNSNFIISQNNKFIDNHDFIDKINTKNLIKNKINNKNKNLFAFDPNQIFSPVFSFLDNQIEINTLENTILNIVNQNN